MEAFIIIIAIILCILGFIYLFKKKEPFVNAVKSNISANPDEVYLLALNTGSFNIIGKSDTYAYSTGYTHSAAEKACEENGGRLADLKAISSSPSKLSLEIALELGANWCAAGWTKTSSTYAYFPMSDLAPQNACNLNILTRKYVPVSTGTVSGTKTTRPNPNPTIPEPVRETTGISIQPTDLNPYYLPSTPGIGVYKPADGLAFAICVGPKPPEPSARVNPFNSTSYSMYDENMMTYLTTGVDTVNPYKSDIFPVEFTKAQVYVALKNATGPTTGTTGPTGPTPYNIENARKLLVNNYKLSTPTSDPLNAPLKTPSMISISSLPDNPNNPNNVGNSCTLLNNAYTSMDTQLSSLKTVFAEISGNVVDMIQTKEINGTLQTVIASICSNTQNKTKTAACERLLSLDYDVLYRNKSTQANVEKNIITDLGLINRALLSRQCEIQQALGSLQIILKSMTRYQSSPTSSTMIDMCSTQATTNQCCITYNQLTSKYKNNTIVNSKNQSGLSAINCITYFDSSGNPTDDVNSNYPSPDTAFQIGREIDINDVDTLKIKLEEISPFFSSTQYASLVSDVLNQLSVTLRTPLPTEYGSINSLVSSTMKLYEVIAGIFPNLVTPIIGTTI